MNNTQAVAAIVGFLMPPVIAFITKENWTPQLKGLIAFAVCVLATLATLGYESSVDWHNVKTLMPIVFISAISTYHFWWKPTGISDAVGKTTG